LPNWKILFCIFDVEVGCHRLKVIYLRNPPWIGSGRAGNSCRVARHTHCHLGRAKRHVRLLPWLKQNYGRISL
jgi:hypothetical protein